MVNKLAIDWDDNELRLVAAQCGGRSVKVIDASVIPVEGGDVKSTLRKAIEQRGLSGTETLVAIGRGKAELRELQLPPVPEDELPEMVRFQAIRNFATAGESAIVDFLVTNRSDSGVEMIAAAVGPQTLTSIQETCETASVPVSRIALRPLAAAALYLINKPSGAGKGAAPGKGDTVLIDLLSDDAEIVVARDGKVIFVRTVRMPGAEAARARALAGELKRSLFACGSTGSLDRVILWGRESVHSDEVEMLAEASGSSVEVLNPFDLVDVDRKASLPDHVGRLAPLVGLLAADGNDPGRLVDFLNPRERHVEVPSPYLRAALIAAPIALVALLGFLVYGKLKGLDRRIEDLKQANAAMEPNVEAAQQSIAKTETVDGFLDGDVNWLNEIRRMAVSMPPADKMIVRSVSASSSARGGGGTMKVEGAATNPSIIDVFESALRDDGHQVTGDGASAQKTNDAYRWGFTESISVNGEVVRNGRYVGIDEAAAAQAVASASATDSAEADTSEESRDAPGEQGSGKQGSGEQAIETESSTPDESAPPDDPPDEAASTEIEAESSNRGDSDDAETNEENSEVQA